MKDAWFCEMKSQFRFLCNTKKNQDPSTGTLFCAQPDGSREMFVFSLFCKDRSQSEVDQDDHTEDDTVVSEEFEVMFLDVSE